MKQLWLELDSTLSEEGKTKLLEEAARFCEVAVVSSSDIQQARSRGLKIASEPERGDIDIIDSYDETVLAKLKKTGRQFAVKVTVESGEDEKKALRIAESGATHLIVHCPNWKIIPLENLVAKARGKTILLAAATSVGEAKIAVEALELGVDGVVLRAKSPEELRKAAESLKAEDARVELTSAKIVRLTPLGMGARVCVDTCDLMEQGEGILVGSQASGMFLIEAEIFENPHVATRPFRVNAGPVSLYLLTSRDKTRYLSELKAGDKILIVNRKGQTRTSNIGRVKIERRPLILVEAERDGREYKTIVQNAETIRLVTANGSRSVSELKPGDEVLLRVEEGGRHFGVLVKEEMVIER